MLHIELVGYLAGLIIAVSLTPQVIKAWKTKSTKDISVLWNSIYVIGLSLWIYYGFGINSKPLIFTITIELILALSLLYLKIKYDKKK